MRIPWPILYLSVPDIHPSTWRDPDIPLGDVVARINNGRNEDIVKEHELVVGLAGLPVLWPIQVAPCHEWEASLGGALAASDDHWQELVAPHDVVTDVVLPPISVDPRLVRPAMEPQNRAKCAHLCLAQELRDGGKPTVAATVWVNVRLEVMNSSVHHRFQVVVHGCEVAIPPNRVPVVCRMLGHQHRIQRSRYGTFYEGVLVNVVTTDLVVRSLH
mmetsp:Transcript_40749/g.114118  ORF Transcript_40749/g.114118 Transcript_40749/m.114118 type:complete len:216 (+) Transcript_40749:636-1283(+)